MLHTRTMSSSVLKHPLIAADIGALADSVSWRTDAAPPYITMSAGSYAIDHITSCLYQQASLRPLVPAESLPQASCFDMSADQYHAWESLSADQQQGVMSCFDKWGDGQLVLGEVQNSIAFCSEGGGGAVVNASTSKITDLPVYFCTVLSGGKLGDITHSLSDGVHKGNGTLQLLITRGPTSAAMATAMLPSQMGAWWWLPILASVALAAIR